MEAFMQLARGYLFDVLELGALCAFIAMIGCLASAFSG
jgi:hypothetical protein